ncbi:MAG: amino acid permease [Bacteroidetes bacterium]|nr:amino acid permease [Bacteroidota bacterium]
MTSTTVALKRKISLIQATSINMIDMAGIGPFVVIYLVIQISAGPHFLYAWFLGALLSFADALIWSELGAAYPMAGGSYNFLKIAYGKEKGGKLFSFLYVWQTMIQAPLVMASAAIGFSEYLSFFVPLSPAISKIISGSLIILVVIALYRKIEEIGKISIALWISMITIFSWIIIGGIMHGNMLEPLKHINENIQINQLFFVALGQSTVKTIYTYLGYYNICQLGGEIVNPEKNIPKSMLISVAGISVLYIATNLSITSVIPWQSAMKNKYIASEFIKSISGNHAANIGTVIILLVAFASLFSATLGYSRVPYAAAKDGAFFPVFSRLHPTKNFPYVSLLFLGGVAFVFSLLFKMKHVIDGILAMRILVQFVAQAIGVVLLRKRNGTIRLPFKMWLYPLPVIVSIPIWLFIFFSTGMAAIFAAVLIIAGIIVYYLTKDWWKKEINFEFENK